MAIIEPLRGEVTATAIVPERDATVHPTVSAGGAARVRQPTVVRDGMFRAIDHDRA